MQVLLCQRPKEENSLGYHQLGTKSSRRSSRYQSVKPIVDSNVNQARAGSQASSGAVNRNKSACDTYVAKETNDLKKLQGPNADRSSSQATNRPHSKASKALSQAATPQSNNIVFLQNVQYDNDRKSSKLSNQKGNQQNHVNQRMNHLYQDTKVINDKNVQQDTMLSIVDKNSPYQTFNHLSAVSQQNQYQNMDEEQRSPASDVDGCGNSYNHATYTDEMGTSNRLLNIQIQNHENSEDMYYGDMTQLYEIFGNAEQTQLAQNSHGNQERVHYVDNCEEAGYEKPCQMTDPFTANPESFIPRYYHCEQDFALPDTFEPSICYIVSNQFDLKKLLALNSDDLDVFVKSLSPQRSAGKKVKIQEEETGNLLADDEVSQESIDSDGIINYTRELAKYKYPNVFEFKQKKQLNHVQLHQMYDDVQKATQQKQLEKKQKEIEMQNQLRLSLENNGVIKEETKLQSRERKKRVTKSRQVSKSKDGERRVQREKEKNNTLGNLKADMNIKLIKPRTATQASKERKVSVSLERDTSLKTKSGERIPFSFRDPEDYEKMIKLSKQRLAKKIHEGSHIGSNTEEKLYSNWKHSQKLQIDKVQKQIEQHQKLNSEVNQTLIDETVNKTSIWKPNQRRIVSAKPRTGLVPHSHHNRLGNKTTFQFSDRDQNVYTNNIDQYGSKKNMIDLSEQSRPSTKQFDILKSGISGGINAQNLKNQISSSSIGRTTITGTQYNKKLAIKPDVCSGDSLYSTKHKFNNQSNQSQKPRIDSSSKMKKQNANITQTQVQQEPTSNTQRNSQVTLHKSKLSSPHNYIVTQDDNQNMNELDKFPSCAPNMRSSESSNRLLENRFNTQGGLNLETDDRELQVNMAPQYDSQPNFRSHKRSLRVQACINKQSVFSNPKERKNMLLKLNKKKTGFSQMKNSKSTKNITDMPQEIIQPPNFQQYYPKQSMTVRTGGQSMMQRSDSQMTAQQAQQAKSIRIQKNKLKEIQENIKAQFLSDNDYYLSNLLTQKDKERYYLAEADLKIHQLSQNISSEALKQVKNNNAFSMNTFCTRNFDNKPINLSELIRDRLKRQQTLPDTTHESVVGQSLQKKVSTENMQSLKYDRSIDNIRSNLFTKRESCKSRPLSRSILQKNYQNACVRSRPQSASNPAKTKMLQRRKQNQSSYQRLQRVSQELLDSQQTENIGNQYITINYNQPSISNNNNFFAHNPYMINSGGPSNQLEDNINSVINKHDFYNCHNEVLVEKDEDQSSINLKTKQQELVPEEATNDQNQMHSIQHEELNQIIEEKKNQILQGQNGGCSVWKANRSNTSLFNRQGMAAAKNRSMKRKSTFMQNEEPELALNQESQGLYDQKFVNTYQNTLLQKEKNILKEQQRTYASMLRNKSYNGSNNMFMIKRGDGSVSPHGYTPVLANRKGSNNNQRSENSSKSRLTPIRQRSGLEQRKMCNAQILQPVLTNKRAATFQQKPSSGLSYNNNKVAVTQQKQTSPGHKDHEHQICESNELQATPSHSKSHSPKPAPKQMMYQVSHAQIQEHKDASIDSRRSNQDIRMIMNSTQKSKKSQKSQITQQTQRTQRTPKSTKKPIRSQNSSPDVNKMRNVAQRYDMGIPGEEKFEGEEQINITNPITTIKSVKSIQSGALVNSGEIASNEVGIESQNQQKLAAQEDQEYLDCDIIKDQLNNLMSQVKSLKEERISESQQLMQQKKQFLAQYKHILPEKERLKLIREINDEMVKNNEKYLLLEF